MTTSTTSQPYSGVPFDNASVAGRLAELPATADAEALTVSTDQGEFAAFRATPAHPNPDLGDAVLMHGWPEFASCWEKTAALLLEQGMGVFAYDQRGYSPGVRPDSVGGGTQSRAWSPTSTKSPARRDSNASTSSAMTGVDSSRGPLPRTTHSVCTPARSCRRRTPERWANS